MAKASARTKQNTQNLMRKKQLVCVSLLSVVADKTSGRQSYEKANKNYSCAMNAKQGDVQWAKCKTNGAFRPFQLHYQLDSVYFDKSNFFLSASQQIEKIYWIRRFISPIFFSSLQPNAHSLALRYK